MKLLAGLLFISGMVITMFGLVDGNPSETLGGLVTILISLIGTLPED